MALTREDLTQLLRRAANEGATEVHFKVPQRPMLRLHGALLPTDYPTMTPQSTHGIANLLGTLATRELAIAQITHCEFSFGVHGVGRFHALLYRQRGTIAILLRPVAMQITPLDQLGFPTSVESVLHGPGLTLIGGGRRRHAVLAALVDRFNASHRGFVVNLENPLSHLHRDAMATIVQRGVGTDVESYREGIVGALRQQADLLALGEIPDTATAEAVLTAAEDGVPTLACVAAPSVSVAPSFLLRHFPGGNGYAAARLDRLLRGVLILPDEGTATWQVDTPDRERAAS